MSKVGGCSRNSAQSSRHYALLIYFSFVKSHWISIPKSIKDFLILVRLMEMLIHFKEKTNLIFEILIYLIWKLFLVAQTVQNLLAMLETRVWSLSWEDPLEKGMATHSSIFAWTIPWTEDHDWVIFTFSTPQATLSILSICNPEVFGTKLHFQIKNNLHEYRFH